MPGEFELPASVTCLCTVIKNISGKEVWILLPKHGTTLADNEQYVMIGSFDTWLQKLKYRSRDSILKALLTNVITIISTPAQHLTDGVTTKVVSSWNAVNNTALVGTPCWD